LKGLRKLLSENLGNDVKGTYILLMELRQRKTIRIGKLGKFLFEKGEYLYIGSAKGGFRKRTMRYFTKIKHKKWHIDYLLEYAEPKGIFFFEDYFDEENLALTTENLYDPYIKGFGASDTHSKTHLFYRREEK